MKYPNGFFNEKPCRLCKTSFKPEAPSHLYCSPLCVERGFDDAYYKRTYGLSFEEVDAMRIKQKGLCAICGNAGFLMRKHHRQTLVVDHDHVTGKVRELLCHNCNRALGLLKDNLKVIQKAARYIKVHKEGATTIP